MLDLSVIILTYNEQIHIRRCIESVKPIAKQIIVIDSNSTDETLSIVKDLGAEVYVHKWPGNQAEQFNWALDNISITGKWIFRIDADEYITKDLENELKSIIPNLNESITGILIPRHNFWMQRKLNRGSSNIKILRIFRTGYGRSESRLMDEHIQLTGGETIEVTKAFVDDNLNNLSWWSNKHIGYAIREATEMLDMEYNLNDCEDKDNLNLDQEASRKRNKKNTYSKLPLFWRSFFYFLYRYIVKGGFLEGKEGFLRHFLQGWWYRTLVDAKIYEIKKISGGDKEKIKQILLSDYGIRI